MPSPLLLELEEYIATWHCKVLMPTFCSAKLLDTPLIRITDDGREELD